MKYAIRQISPPGKSAHADQATAVALLEATVTRSMVLGPYLQWFDVNARGGLGDDRWTDDVKQALKFDTFLDAANAWKTTSRKRPFRDDGKPNRPLTAYSVSIERIDE